MVTDLPQVPTPRKALEDLYRQTRSRLISDGRLARKCNFPIDSCPPFSSLDMRTHWRDGWRWEDEEIRARDSMRDHPRCVINNLGECLARTPAACICLRMAKNIYQEARDRLLGKDT